MSLFNKGPSSIDKTPSASGKTIRLNPDAKEFVPFALRSPSATVGPPDASSSFVNFGTTTTLGKAVLDRSESSVSHNSDDEVHDYWRHQLPDDITPDFNNATGDEDSLGINALCLSSLSLADVNKASRFTNSFQKESSHHPLSSGFRQSSAEPWDTHGQQLVSDIRDGPSYNGDRGHAYLDVMLNKQHESTEVNPLDFLASQFAGSTAESLADAYFANAGKLNITTERLAQLELQEGGFNWKHNRDPYQDTAIGLSRSSRDLTSSYYDDHGRMKYGDRLANRSSTRSAPVWLETGDAVANMYSEMCGEARDHARLRNAYFEQARKAYLIGHKALAKELSVKGQLHNMQMKAAYDKAQESIYRQRNPVSPAMHRNGRGHERLIDLQGLHVIEAIHVLKRDLTVLRNAARSADQHLQVYIRVGMGHYTRGTHTPARLVAVQRYLLEEEGLDYSEPQPGLLRVQIF